MAKKPLALISSLTMLLGGFVGVAPASAAGIDYSFSDMIGTKNNFEIELRSLCGADISCRESHFNNYRNRFALYKALDVFENTKFMAPTINPSLGTMSLYFNDVDQNARAQGIVNHEALTSVSLAWTDASGEKHSVFESVKAKIALPGLKEFELPKSDNLSENVGGLLDYQISYGENKTLSGTIDYSACLASYQAGQECQLKFNSDGTAHYVAAAPAAPTTTSETYWTLPEILEIRDQIVAEQAACDADDRACKEDIFDSHRGDAWYYALDSFVNYYPFLVTKFNFQDETVGLFYQQNNPIVTRMSDNSAKNPLSSIYLFWLDEAKDTYRTVDILSYVAAIQNDSTPDFLHVIYADAAKNEEALFPADEEVEFSMKGADLLLNYNRDYVLHWSTNGSSTGPGFYQSCVDSPDFTENSECRIVFTSDGVAKLLPFKVATKPVEDQETVIPAGSTAGKGAATASTASSNSSKNAASASQNAQIAATSLTASGESDENSNDSTDPAELTVSETTSENPESAKNLDYAYAATTETKPVTGLSRSFPHWTLVLVAALAGTLIWWFLPIRRQNQRKSAKIAKKSKKSVDKFSKVR